MNETMKTILSRRSIRKFSSEEIEEEVLREIVNAGMHAPSAMCKKTWQFTVVSNKEVIKRLSDAISMVLKRQGYDMYGPVALIIPSNHRDNVFGREDNACALENIFLAAKSYNIGSVWLNQLNNICDIPEIREILKELSIPDEHVVYGFAALGYADKDFPAPEYREIGVVNFIR